MIAHQHSDQGNFWNLADITKNLEKYRIDKNLKKLKFVSFDYLKKVFIQYRFFTHFYIEDLALLVSKLPYGELKSILAEILNEELGNGNANEAHPILYDNFLLSIGIQQHELEKANERCLSYLKQVQHSLKNRSWSYGVGLRGMGGECLCQIYLATMHENFAQNPHIIAIQDKVAWKFWEIHSGEVDQHHQFIVRNAINNIILAYPETAKDLINGYLESKTAWDNYWEQIFSAAKEVANESSNSRSH